MFLDQNCQKLYKLHRILLENPNNFINAYVTKFSNQNLPNENWSKVGVDFSSPNIAKPFHVGHLRSTFLGRFVTNILQSSGMIVTKINYLGDWGTQFGILAAGFEKFGDENELNEKKIMHLYDIYVKANAEAAANPEFASRALKIFSSMELGDSKALDFWKRSREISIAEFTELYDRMNVRFDVWQSESMFAERSRNLIVDFLSKNLFVRTDDGLIGAKTEPLPGSDKEYHFIPVAKSDGSSLYLTRDIIAAIERVDQLKFDHIYYVVDTGQERHFMNLKLILKYIGRPDVADKITHIKFGLIEDISSRKGKTVFVNDMLKQGEQIAVDILKSTSTTKSSEDQFKNVAFNMALTAFMINDMKKKRTSGYKYDWSKILKATGGNYGYLFQAAYARLCSVEEKCREFVPLLNFNSFESFYKLNFVEPEALNLCKHMFEDLQSPLNECLTNFETCSLIEYLITLSHRTNAVHKHLRVVVSPDDVRIERLLLFSTARLLLGQLMSLLGVNPQSKL